MKLSIFIIDIIYACYFLQILKQRTLIITIFIFVCIFYSVSYYN